MNQPYWQDGKWHSAEQPMSDEQMMDLEVKLQEALDKCADVHVCKLIEEAAQVAFIRIFKDEQDEQDQAA